MILKNSNGGPVHLGQNLPFLGTLICNAGFVLDGKHIQLNPVTGFPAIISNDTLYIAKNADATINGIVVTSGDVAPWDYNNAKNASTVINGGLIAPEGFWQSSIKGTHVINYTAENCRLYDFSPTGNTATTTGLTLLDAY